MRTVKVEITWPEATSIVGVAHLEAPEFSVPVLWQGDSPRVASLPPKIAPKAGGELCTLASLFAGCRAFAETEGATFTWSADGDYDFWA